MLILLIVLVTTCCSAKVYYVTTDGEDCSNCHPLSYYTSMSQWPRNVTLIFRKGEHTLKDQPLTIVGLESVILKKSNQSSSDAFINCGKMNESNVIKIANISGTVYVEGLKIKCQYDVLFQNVKSNIAISNVQGWRLSIQGYQLLTEVTILQSTFFITENASSLFANSVVITNASRVTIQDTAISNKYGGGLALHRNRENIFLKNVTISDNGKQGLYLGWNGNNITLRNIKVANNNGTGLALTNNGDNIHLNDVTSANNTNGLVIVSNGNNIELNDVRVDNSKNFGFYMVSNRDNLSLANVKVNNTKSLAFYIGRNGNKTTLTNITVTNTVHSEGMRIEGNGNEITLVNIVADNNSASGLRLNNNGFLISLDNIVCSNTQGIGLTIDSNEGSIMLNNITLIKNMYKSLYLSQNSHNISVNNVIIKDTTVQGNGIELSYNGNNVALTNVTVDNCTGIGLMVLGNGNNLILSNVMVTNNSYGTGMYLYSNGKNTMLYNITITNSRLNGIFIERSGTGLALEKIEVANSGVQNVVVRGNNDNITINEVIVRGSKMAFIIYGNGNNIEVANVNITNSKEIPLYVALNGNYFSLTNVNFKNNYLGLRIEDNGNNIALSNIVANDFIENSGIRLNNNGANISLNNIICSNTNNTGLELDSNKDTITLNNIIANNNTLGGIGLFSNGDNIQLHNVTVANNNQGGIQMVYNRYLIILSNTSVINNTDTGIYIEGETNMTFAHQPTTLYNNSSPGNGGGMWIGKDIVISSNTVVNFYNNTARGAGGAVYVDTRASKHNYKNCTFLYLRPTFRNNYGAIAGDDIYGGKYGYCLGGRPDITTFFEGIYCIYNLIRFFPTPVSSHITSSPIGVCQCLNDSVVDYNNRVIHEILYSGQSITIPIVTVGICGGISPGELVTKSTDGVQVILSNTNQETEKQCKNFTYQFLQQSIHIFSGNVSLQHKLVPDKETKYLLYSELTISVTFLPCPLGLELGTGRCRCDSTVSSINGTECDVEWMPNPIKRYGNNWLHYKEEYECIIAHRACPFDYCDTSIVYLSLNESHSQCMFNRSGILCGECQKGLSLMLGSNKCASCNNNYISLFVAFLAAGIVLVAFLMTSNLTVSVGSINDLLFYANIVKLNQTVLFPNGISIPVLSQFIAWLNLDLGIQTCFFNGLDGHWKTWLQFTFPLYIWLLIGFIIIGSYYSGKLSRLCGNNAVPVLATLILMSYSRLLQTITNILMSTKIKCNSYHWVVWNVDGNIGYLSPKHIPLFVAALIFLLIGIIYTILVFSGQWLQRYSGKCCKSSRDPVVKLKPFIDAYTGPYKDNYRFWTGLLLIVRLVLTPVFSYTTGSLSIVHNYIIALTAFILMIFMRGVYRKPVVNVLGYCHFLNLAVLSLLSAVGKDLGFSVYSTTIITGVSISSALLMFIITIIGHIYWKFFGSKKLTHRNQGFNIFSDLTLEENKDVTDEGSPARLVMRRESLIFDFNIKEMEI